MKKVSKLTVLLLALVMVFSLCACGGSDAGKDLIGTWAINYDMADALAEELGSDYADFHAPLEMTLMFDFNADGTFKMYVEEDSFTSNFNTWMDAFLDYSVDSGMEMLYEMYESYGLTAEEVNDAIYEEFGMSMEEYVRETLAAELDMSSEISALLKEVETTGTYETKGSKLYMAEGSSKIDTNAYDIFTITGNKLTLELADGVDPAEAEIAPGLSYPLELQRK